jgi:hypothetical protein
LLCLAVVMKDGMPIDLQMILVQLLVSVAIEC